MAGGQVGRQRCSLALNPGKPYPFLLPQEASSCHTYIETAAPMHNPSSPFCRTFQPPLAWAEEFWGLPTSHADITTIVASWSVCSQSQAVGWGGAFGSPAWKWEHLCFLGSSQVCGPFTP